MKVSPLIATLLTRFHARKPVRIWSLIVTLYGDAIVPRGGSLWIGSLIEIMALFRIDAGHVRTAVSRLSSDGWLSSTKQGRSSYYRLSRSGEDEFLQATQRIYAGVPVRGGSLRIAAIAPSVKDAARTRTMLQEAGYAALSPMLYAGFASLPEKFRAEQDVFLLTPEPDDACALASAAFHLDETAKAYRDFLDEFTPLASSIETTPLRDDEALVARTLLIHAFRRVVLRDPGLPAGLLPDDWSGAAARALAARIYARVVEPSERFLSDHGKTQVGLLPTVDEDFRKRFSEEIQCVKRSRNKI